MSGKDFDKGFMEGYRYAITNMLHHCEQDIYFQNEITSLFKKYNKE